MRKGKRRKKAYVKKQKAKVVYERPYKGVHITITAESSGVYRRPTQEIASHGVDMPGEAKACAVRSQGQTIHEYNKEMLKREKDAQKEAERRKSMIAPMYNKGAYQYIGDAAEEVIEGLGRKK